MTNKLKISGFKAALFSGLAGLAAMAISTLIAFSWRSVLPPYPAVHWGPSGQANRFASVERFAFEFLVIGVVMIILFTFLGSKLGGQSTIRRFIVALNVWTGTFFGAMLLASLWGQRHLPDAATARLGNVPLTLAISLPLLVAAIAWFLVPADPPMPTDAPVPADAPRAELADGQRAIWLRRITSPIGCAIGGFAALLMLASAYWLGSPALAILAIPVILLCVSMLVWTVRVDGTGITVRSILGFPRTHIPLNEVTSAAPTQVSFGDFGGWGYRVGLGGNRVGVITRYGEALQVNRTGGRAFVVTTDEAKSAAALINTLADQSRQ